MLADRYEIRPTMHGGFKIYDSAIGAPCSLGGVALVFESRAQAADWLRFCYRKWGTNPERSENPPERALWKNLRTPPVTPRDSPWAEYTTPVHPSERPYWA